MNKVIATLWDKAAISNANPSWEDQINFIERFTKLIVLEVINTSSHIEGIPDILQHFGIDNE